MRKRKMRISTQGASAKIDKSIFGIYRFNTDRNARMPVVFSHKKLLGKNYNMLCFEYQCSSYLSHVVFMSGGRNPKREYVRDLEPADKWTRYEMDVSNFRDNIAEAAIMPTVASSALTLIFVASPPAKTAYLKLRNIYMRPYNREEIKDRKKKNLDIENDGKEIINRNKYLATESFPCSVNRVEVGEECITISGRSAITGNEVCLCECPVFNDIYGMEISPVKSLAAGAEDFEYSTERFTKIDGIKYDRMYSKWVLAIKCGGQYVLCSHARYATGVHSAHTFDPIVPKTKKGIGDFTINHLESDLDELGASYITVNIRINDFLLSRPGKNTIGFEYNGKTYYADGEEIKKLDDTIIAAHKRNILVSAIILVYPIKTSKDREIGRILQHPEYVSSGVYTMPDMANPVSFTCYAAALDFLASRYNRPDGRYGRIHRWIAHNEADSGWVWVNAGYKTIEEFTDLYVKSMRIILLTALKYDPSAEVFVSITHFWTGQNPESSCFPSKDILEKLLLYTRAEGDFRWGIAHHPYPEILWDPRS